MVYCCVDVPTFPEALFHAFEVILTDSLKHAVSQGMKLWEVSVRVPRHIVEFVNEVVPDEHQAIIVGGLGPESPKVYGELEFDTIVAEELITQIEQVLSCH